MLGRWLGRMVFGFVLILGMGVDRVVAQLQQGPSEPLQVYLLIGQSNMAGRAPIKDADREPIDRCFLLNAEGKWEPAVVPFNRYSTIRKGLGMQKLNPGYGFAQTLTERQRFVSIGLVVNAKGGTRIGQWEKGTPFYTEAVRRAREAQKSGTLRGILWHQGESDNGNPDGYVEKLVQLVQDLRKDLEVPDLPFVAGEVKAGSAINAELVKVPDVLAHTACVSSQGLTTYDRWHFDRRSMLLLGERYAEAMLALQE